MFMVVVPPVTHLVPAQVLDQHVLIDQYTKSCRSLNEAEVERRDAHEAPAASPSGGSVPQCEGLDEPGEIRSLQTEQLRGPRLIPASLVERAADQSLLVRLHARVKRVELRLRARLGVVGGPEAEV